MKKYQVTLKSKSPYLQHRMDTMKLEEWEKQPHRLIEARPELAQEDCVRAEFYCYRNKDDKNFIPADQIRGSLIGAGSFIKSKIGATTKSMKSIVAAMFFIEPEEIIIPDWTVIDKRTAWNFKAKARIVVIRPRWNEWQVTFFLLVDNDTIGTDMIKQLFQYAGNNVGIGSFRPTANGMFGRYELIDLKEIENN